ELLTFSDEDIQRIAASFSQSIGELGYTCYACAIMPDHVHMLIRRHRDKAETMIAHLQNASRDALISSGRRRVEHPVWGGPGWKVFLNSRTDIERIVRYINNNPIKAGRPIQIWDFVQQYDGWLPRPARNGKR